MTTTPPAVEDGLLFHDAFQDGFTTTGPAANWHTQDVAGVPGGDGIARTSAFGLSVIPTGVNPRTGAPAFVSTTGQQADGGEGTRDHVKWTALANRTARNGFPGFDVPEDGALECTATLAVSTYGTADHPFGPAVTDPRADPRLGCGAMIAADVETASIFGFFVTATRVYANYERLRLPGTGYAAYTYAVPVADRSPGDLVTLGVTLDRSRGTVRWTVGGREVLVVDRIGRPALDRRHLLLDHAGEPEDLSPRQLVAGVGMFTLLDGALDADGTALVRIDSAPAHYVHPRSGAPWPQTFLDDRSTAAHRLWGQGVGLTVRDVRVTATGTGR
ncbi:MULTISPECIES: DUF6081 family protein [unclassified Streptomyces]|uniref:DUF6081 family protein n=1 Tax=unclassified Streptomyces TaxID=2593676 RepID=UPI00068A4E7E|nr:MULTISPECIES: DUF6081 family protein [unclassified Streptomyces]KOV83058.1 hypothetical protein ADL02_22320 [Streptomyces sp. NRRL WC-3723]